MTNLDPAPPVAAPLRLALSSVLLHAARLLIRAAEAVTPPDRSDPSGPDDGQRATQNSRSAGNGQGRRQGVVPGGYAQGRADLQLTTLIDPDPRARQVPGLGRVIEPPITGAIDVDYEEADDAGVVHPRIRPAHDPGRPR